MLPAGSIVGASSVQVELIEIINKPLLLHLVVYLYYWQMGCNSVFKGLKWFVCEDCNSIRTNRERVDFGIDVYCDECNATWKAGWPAGLMNAFWMKMCAYTAVDLRIVEVHVTATCIVVCHYGRFRGTCCLYLQDESDFWLSRLRLKDPLKHWYRYAPRNDVSVNDRPRIRRWSHKIIILYYVIL